MVANEWQDEIKYVSMSCQTIAKIVDDWLFSYDINESSKIGGEWGQII